MRSLKICMTAILAALCALFVALGTFTLTTAKADAPAPTTFTVLDNASIRLFNNENGAYGIRFKAYVGDTAKETPVDGAEYKMAIVPTQLIDLYNATDKTKNVVDWLNDYAKSKGGTIETATCTPDSDGYITAAITDIYWFNLNRKFSAIAYYEINDQIGDVATLALDGSRSIVDVATAFKNSGEATTEETVVLDKFIAEGAEQNSGVLVGSQTASSFLSINSTYSTGTIETVTTEKGDGWKINVTEIKSESYPNVELVYNKDLVAQRLAGYDTVRFSVYNQGSSNSQKLYLNAGTGIGSTGVTYPITAQSWNDYTVPASVISSCSYITIPHIKLNADYYVTNFQAYTAAEMGAQVVTIIDALPSIEDMDAFDKAQITAARSAYDALSDKAKTYVTNLSDLTALETAYDEKFVIVFDMSDISGFSVYSSEYGNGSATTLSKGSDTIYGDYLSAKIATKTHEHLSIKYPKTGLETTLAECDYVYFYVYNGQTADKGLLANFTGKAVTKYNDITLTKDCWTLIQVPVSQFIAGTYFGIGSVGSNAEYKFSMFWATKVDVSVANDVMEMIDALPEIDTLTGLDGSSINAVRTAYDALHPVAQAVVTNYAEFKEIEATYDKYYVMIEDMDGSSMFSFNTGYTTTQATLSYGDDAEYGEYMNIHYIAGSGNFIHGVVTMTFNGVDLSGCEKVYLYVYNGGTANRNLLTNIGGSLVTNYATLVAGEWTLVEFNAADFVTGKYMGVYSAQADTDYKFSAIYATTAAYEAKSVVEMIDNLPSENALTGIDYAKITAARSAYDALSSTTQTAVTNYANLQALETAYAEKFVMVDDMSSAANYEQRTGFTNNPSAYLSLSVTQDDVYGNCLSVTKLSTDDNAIVNYTIADLATTLSDCEKVCFYVYNGASAEKTLYATFGTGSGHNIQKVAAQSWAYIEMSVADFIAKPASSASYFGFLSFGAGNSFKVSAIWATKTVAEQ